MNKFIFIILVALIAFASCEDQCVGETKDACVKSKAPEEERCCFYEIASAAATCIPLPSDKTLLKAEIDILKKTGSIDCGANYFKVFTVAMFAFAALL